jgi:hypothetical protein
MAARWFRVIAGLPRREIEAIRTALDREAERRCPDQYRARTAHLRLPLENADLEHRSPDSDTSKEARAKLLERAVASGRLRQLGGFFSVEELVEQLRAAAALDGAAWLAFEEYRRTASAQMALPVRERRVARYPLSRRPFARFGGYDRVAFEAFGPPPPRPRRNPTGQSESRRGTVSEPRPRKRALQLPRGDNYSDADIIERVRLEWDLFNAATPPGAPQLILSRAEFNRLSLARYHAALAEGRVIARICAGTVAAHHGGHFANGLAAAGLIDERQRRLLLRSGNVERWTNEKIAARVKLAADHLGAEFGKHRYANIRDQLHAACPNDMWAMPSHERVARLAGGDFAKSRQMILSGRVDGVRWRPPKGGLRTVGQDDLWPTT